MRAVFNKEDQMVNLRKRVFARIGPFEFRIHSKQAQGIGLKHLFPATTRWSSLDTTFNRVLKLRPSMAKLCYDNVIEDISSGDYRSVEKVVKITGPLRAFEKKLQQESVPTISLVYDGINGLLSVIEKLRTSGILPDICKKLNAELRSRFQDVLKSGEDDSDPVFIVAAVMDPIVAQTTMVLDEKLEVCCAAVKGMAKLLIDGYDGTVQEVTEVPSTSGTDVFGFDLPMRKKRRVVVPEKDRVQAELDEYRFVVQHPVKCTAAEFWLKNDAKLRMLATIARSVLAVPA